MTNNLYNSSNNFSDISTSTFRTFIVEDDEPIGVSLGIFASILFGSLFFIFILLGMCILWHSFYMKCLKKRYKHHDTQVVASPDKPKVILDLSHQLNMIDNDEDFENNPKRIAKAVVEDFDDLDETKDTQSPEKTPKEVEITGSEKSLRSVKKSSDVTKEEDNKATTNYAFVNSNITLSCGNNVSDKADANTEDSLSSRENYVNLVVSKI